MGPVFGGLLILLAVFGIAPPAVADDSPANAVNAPTVTIRGSISNINDIGGYVVNGSCLQLYPCETTGILKLQLDKQGMPIQPDVAPDQKYYQDALGRLVPLSELPLTAFPDFGSFSFNRVTGLTPGGCYKICVKMLDRPYPGFVPLAGPDGKTREIIIPEIKESGSPQDILIDLTKETLIVPDPATLSQNSDKKDNKPAGKKSGNDFWK